MASAYNALIAIATVAVMPLIAGCSRESDSVPDRSELPQIFYDPPKDIPKYPFKRLSREPGRLIETPLRPSQMMARLPSAYLRSIGHPWEPYAKQIWDFANFGFDIGTLAPAAADKIGDVRNPGHVISIELGGYSQTSHWMTGRKIFKTDKIIKTGPVEVIKMSATGHIDHVFYSPKEAEIDGDPALVSCLKTCEATLTITPDMAGVPSEPPVQKGHDPNGIALKISFDETFVPRWPEIRAKALCFAAVSISGFEGRGNVLNANGNCSAVRKAIAATIQ